MENTEKTSNDLDGMELKAITYCYIQDGMHCNKVIGIFKRSQLQDALDDIKIGFGSNKKIKEETYDQSCDNYFLEFEDDQKSYFHTSNFVVGELYL